MMASPNTLFYANVVEHLSGYLHVQHEMRIYDFSSGSIIPGLKTRVHNLL